MCMQCMSHFPDPCSCDCPVPIPLYRNNHSQSGNRKVAWWLNNQRKGLKGTVITAVVCGESTVHYLNARAHGLLRDALRGPAGRHLWDLPSTVFPVFLLPTHSFLEIWIYSTRLQSSFANLVSHLFYLFRSRLVLSCCFFSSFIFKGISLQFSSSTQRS